MDSFQISADTDDSIFVRNTAADEPSRTLCLSIGLGLCQPTILALKSHFFDNATNSNSVYITSNGKIAGDDEKLVRKQHYCIHLRVLGGKGGFGSLLRSFGSQISKNRNQDACRDLSGRRLRNVKAEKRVKELVEKKAEKDKEKEKKKAEKIQKLKTALQSKPKHHFNDPEYEKQRSLIPEKVFNAVEEGNKVIAAKSANEESALVSPDNISVSPKPSGSDALTSADIQPNDKKRKHVDPLETDMGNKRMKGWLGIPDSDTSDEEGK